MGKTDALINHVMNEPSDFEAAKLLCEGVGRLIEEELDHMKALPRSKAYKRVRRVNALTQVCNVWEWLDVQARSIGAPEIEGYEFVPGLLLQTGDLLSIGGDSDIEVLSVEHNRTKLIMHYMDGTTRQMEKFSKYEVFYRKLNQEVIPDDVVYTQLSEDTAAFQV